MCIGVDFFFFNVFLLGIIWLFKSLVGVLSPYPSNISSTPSFLLLEVQLDMHYAFLLCLLSLNLPLVCSSSLTRHAAL